jgi:hypothetical protein
MITVNGLAAHPLVIHAVVVLLPLAAAGTLLVAARPTWRRNLGVPVFLLALVGALAVPIATETGDQLKRALGGGGRLVQIHEQRADRLLPYTILFAASLLATLVVGRRADRVEDSGQVAGITAGLGVLAAVSGLVVTGLVIWVADAGAMAVWQGVGTGRTR